ncbi:MAG: hypothetical protein IKW98_00485 [Prevotella sp.]|nr:hypothetical protein [Prevotella sp.]
MKKSIRPLFYIGAIAFIIGWALWRFADISAGAIVQYVGLVLMIPYWLGQFFKLFSIGKYPADQKKTVAIIGIMSLIALILAILFIIILVKALAV